MSTLFLSVTIVDSCAISPVKSITRSFSLVRVRLWCSDSLPPTLPTCLCCFISTLSHAFDYSLAPPPLPPLPAPASAQECRAACFALLQSETRRSKNSYARLGRSRVASPDRQTAQQGGRGRSPEGRGEGG